MPSFVDLTGQIFGNVRVDSRAPNYRMNKRTSLVMFNCTCLLCGNQFVARATNLKSGNTTSDGCTNKEGVSKAQLHDLTGQKFGKLTVIQRAPDKIRKDGQKRPKWFCKCDCGKTVSVLADSLTTGQTRSCGCIRKELAAVRYVENLAGQTFGSLRVLERAENVDNNLHTAWLCQCVCGNKVVVRSACLKNGTNQSCGCKKFSNNTRKIKDLLSAFGISFIPEYKFKDLYRVKGHYLRFDFALFGTDCKLKGLIEYQGQQHYEERINADFGKVQREETDPMKKDYCKKNNIPLFEIKYNDDIKSRLNDILHELNLKHDNPVPSSA